MSGHTLSEANSKALLARYGVVFAPECRAGSSEEALGAAADLGLPVVLKLNGDAIAHKTERGLVRLGLATNEAVEIAAQELLDAATPEDGEVDLLVAPMLRGNRELIAGIATDPQFAKTVMVGIGGIFAEAIGDVSIRPVPVSLIDAHEMIDDLQTQALLGEFRGEPAIDRDALAVLIVALSDVATSEPEVVSVDINPLIVVNGRPIAVDALVEQGANELAKHAAGASGSTSARDGQGAPTVQSKPSSEGFRALFEPRGVVVAGASSHPGKFGFVSLHNILASGYEGKVAATNRDGTQVLGISTLSDLNDLEAGEFDLIFMCTPAAANLDLLRVAAAKGIKAAFVTSAGYGEAGEDGIVAQRELVKVCEELGILLAGPNGQGVVSTPSALCAQIVAPYPPLGRIGVASQSGNFVSSFLNYSIQTGVGISRAVSAGNAAACGVGDFLEFYAQDDATSVGLGYVEGVVDGRRFLEQVSSVAQMMPLVLVKGGATSGGQRAAASHTGSLATNDRVFDGACRQAGVTRASTVEEAFDAAATFATQPLPKGPTVVVMTTAGGWGVVTADAITNSNLELASLPDDLLHEIDKLLPPRWSRNNPVDLAGGETRDTIPDVLALIAEHPGVDAVIQLGIGIQSNQAQMMRRGRFYPDNGLERIVAYHERQDERFAQAAAEISARTAKPILLATELAVADPSNAAPAAVRASGRLCYSSANRAVTALSHAWDRQRWLSARGLG